MQRILLALFLVAVLVAVSLGTSWRTSRRTLEAAFGETVALSNKLAQASAQVAEKDAAIQTLRVKQDLRATDLNSFSNHLSNLKADLTKAQDQTRLRAEQVRRSEAEVAAGRAEVSDLQRRLAQREAQIQSLRAELAAAGAAVRTKEQEVALQQARANEAETERARLLQQWNDPSQVRAQSKRLSDSPSALRAPFLPAHRPKVAIAPDGTVSELES